MTVTWFLVLLVAVFAVVWALLAADAALTRRRAQRDWTVSDRCLDRLERLRQQEADQ